MKEIPAEAATAYLIAGNTNAEQVIERKMSAAGLKSLRNLKSALASRTNVGGSPSLRSTSPGLATAVSYL